MSVLFCDSNCELWHDILEENDVKLIKMPYYIDGEEYFYDCGKDTDFKEFYKKLREKSMPATAALNTYNYLEIFEPYFMAGEDILYLSFSSEMSPTFDFLNNAIKELKSKYPGVSFTRFDTRNISLGAGILVYYAIILKKQGVADAKIVEKLIYLRDKVGVYFVVDDLKHLKRGGKLSASAAFFGGLLNTKPILSVENGKLKPIDKVSGRKHALRELLKKFEKKWNKNFKEVWIVGADCSQDVDFMEMAIKGKCKSEIDIKKQPVGPVVSTHCGPDTLGIIFIKKEIGI